MIAHGCWGEPVGDMTGDTLALLITSTSESTSPPSGSMFKGGTKLAPMQMMGSSVKLPVTTNDLSFTHVQNSHPLVWSDGSAVKSI